MCFLEFAMVFVFEGTQEQKADCPVFKHV